MPTTAPIPTPVATATVTPIVTPTPSHSPASGGGTTTGSGAGSSPIGSTATEAPGSGTAGGTGSSGGGQAESSPGSTGPLAGIMSGTGAPSDPAVKRGGSAAFIGSLAHYLATGVSSGSVPAGVPADPFGGRNESPAQLMVALAPTLATGSAGALAWAAFAFFGKRRRDGDEPEYQAFALAAASAYQTEAAPGLSVIDESLLPRWRRPSLQQVRRNDPLRAMAEEPGLSFESAGVRPLDNYERRHIRYRLVRLLDSPDELRSREIGILDKGDEVQLLESRRAFWLVLCPDGRQGWVHRMTLADPPAAAMGDADLEPMPQYMDDDDAPAVLEDVAEPGADGLLEAYMRARSDVLRTMAADGTVSARVSAAPHVEIPATALPPEEPVSAAVPAAESARAGERYSGRKNAGSRKAATASRPGTRSRRPSR
jgi:hypothetical protein